MKSALLFAFAAIMSLAVNAQPDTLYIGTPQTDTLNGSLIACYSYACDPIESHSYYCQTAYNGVLDIFGADGVVYEILIVTESQYVVIDTCVTLFSFAGGQLMLPYAYPSGFEVIVNGPAWAWVNIASKVDPINSYDSLPLPIVDLDTLCATYTPEPLPTPRLYYDLETLSTNPQPITADALKPDHVYKVVK